MRTSAFFDHKKPLASLFCVLGVLFRRPNAAQSVHLEVVSLAAVATGNLADSLAQPHTRELAEQPFSNLQ